MTMRALFMPRFFILLSTYERVTHFMEWNLAANFRTGKMESNRIFHPNFQHTNPNISIRGKETRETRERERKGERKIRKEICKKEMEIDRVMEFEGNLFLFCCYRIRKSLPNAYICIKKEKNTPFIRFMTQKNY